MPATVRKVEATMDLIDEANSTLRGLLLQSRRWTMTRYISLHFAVKPDSTKLLLRHCRLELTLVAIQSSSNLVIIVITLTCLHEMAAWLRANRLSLNPSKSQFMHCAAARRLEQLDDSPITPVTVMVRGNSEN